MTNDDVVKVYTLIADKYGKEFFTELDNKPLDRKLYDLFIDRMGDNAKCLEIGCGPGEIAAYLYKKGLNVVGIDKSSEMIETARKLCPEIVYHIDDVFELHIENEQYDGVVAPFLNVNFSDQEIDLALKEMNRVMKMKGKLLITFHIGNNKILKIDNFFDSGKEICFIMHDVNKVKEKIKRNGFSITEVVIKEPYEGEQTKRAFIYGTKYEESA